MAADLRHVVDGGGARGRLWSDLGVRRVLVGVLDVAGRSPDLVGHGRGRPRRRALGPDRPSGRRPVAQPGVPRRRAGGALSLHRRPVARRRHGARSDRDPQRRPELVVADPIPRRTGACSECRWSRRRLSGGRSSSSASESTSTSSASTRSIATASCAATSARPATRPKERNPQNFTGFDDKDDIGWSSCQRHELAQRAVAHRQLRAQPRWIGRPGPAHPAQRVVHAVAAALPAATTSRATSMRHGAGVGFVADRRDSAHRTGRPDARPGRLGVGRGGQPEHGLSHVAGHRVPADRVQRAPRLVVSEPDKAGDRQRRRISASPTCVAELFGGASTGRGSCRCPTADTSRTSPPTS